MNRFRKNAMPQCRHTADLLYQIMWSAANLPLPDDWTLNQPFRVLINRMWIELLHFVTERIFHWFLNAKMLARSQKKFCEKPPWKHTLIHYFSAFQTFSAFGLRFLIKKIDFKKESSKNSMGNLYFTRNMKIYQLES